MATKLIATQSYPYAGRSLRTGDAFEASDRDARTLKLIGRAVDAPVLPARTIQTRDLESEDADTLELATPASTPKRRYRRRDLQAEK